MAIHFAAAERGLLIKKKESSSDLPVGRPNNDNSAAETL